MLQVRQEPKPLNISEQIVDDPASGLTLQFEAMPSGETKLTLFGDCLQFGNREFIFDRNGQLGAAGTATSGICRPTWLINTDDL